MPSSRTTRPRMSLRSSWKGRMVSSQAIFEPRLMSRFPLPFGSRILSLGRRGNRGEDAMIRRYGEADPARHRVPSAHRRLCDPAARRRGAADPPGKHRCRNFSCPAAGSTPAKARCARCTARCWKKPAGISRRRAGWARFAASPGCRTTRSGPRSSATSTSPARCRPVGAADRTGPHRGLGTRGETAAEMVGNDGDRAFLQRLFRLIPAVRGTRSSPRQIVGELAGCRGTRRDPRPAPRRRRCPTARRWPGPAARTPLPRASRRSRSAHSVNPSE